MINFATSLVGHWHGGMAVAAIYAAGLFSACQGRVRHRRRDRLDHAAGDAQAWLSEALRRRRDHHRRFARQHDPAVDRDGDLQHRHRRHADQGPDGKIVSNASVGALFMASLVPGIVLAILLGGIAWYRAWRNGYPRMQRAGWRERVRALRESFWGVMLIVVVLGGIYSGLFTPTEAAAMSAVYAFVVAVFVYKDMPLSRIPKVLLDSANMSAMLLYIITNAVLFSYLMTSENIPQAMASWITTTGLSTFQFLLVVNLLLLLAGNVMEPSSIVLIMAPILFPIAVTSRRRPGAFRRPDHAQHGDRDVPPAGRPQSLRGVRDREEWASPS
jgi:C4-dicarboxylate transporter DctM subunit